MSIYRDEDFVTYNWEHSINLQRLSFCDMLEAWCSACEYVSGVLSFVLINWFSTVQLILRLVR